MLAIRGRCLHDNGAYVPSGLTVSATASAPFPGPYALEAFDLTVDVVFTNMVPVTPSTRRRPPQCLLHLRASGRPRRPGAELDPAEIRRRSFIRKRPDALHDRPQGPRRQDADRLRQRRLPACLDSALSRLPISASARPPPAPRAAISASAWRATSRTPASGPTRAPRCA